MSAAHTSGPWDAHFNGSITASVDDSRPLLDIAIGMAFAPEEKGRIAFDVQRANARLMAAAPEMLAKLEKVVAWLDRLADKSERDAKDTRFASLAQAHADDALNYRATADSIRPVILKATEVTA